MDSPPHNSPAQQKDERDLFFVVKISSALGLGTLAAFLYSLKDVHPELRFEIGLGSGVTFLVTAIISWVFCDTMARADAESHAGAGRDLARKRFLRRWLLMFGVLCTLGTLFAFARSLRNVRAEGRIEVLIGTILAVIVLSCGGWLIHRAVKFFEEQDRVALQKRHEDEPPED